MDDTWAGHVTRVRGGGPVREGTVLLDRLDVDDLITCSRAFDELGVGARSMTDVAGRLTRYLADSLVDADGRAVVALTRLYATARLRDLPADLQAFALDVADGDLAPGTRCLTLLGSAGAEEAWNDPARSTGHRAIPLRSVTALDQLPMVLQLLRQFGVDVDDVVTPDPVMAIERHHERFDVFYVPEAAGSPSVPAQDFVADHGIRSVIGCGGMLPNGDLFALVLFLTVPVPPATADLFRSLALSVKSAIVPFTFNVFA